MSLKDIRFNELKAFPKEFQDKMIEKKDNELNDAFEQGYDLCMIKTMDLLMDTKLKENILIELLQIHFDLRRSEAESLIKAAKNRKTREINEKK